MKKAKSKSFNTYWLFPLAMIMLVMHGCATIEPPAKDPMAYMDRAQSSVIGDLKVTVAVPTMAEAHALYNVRLSTEHIQPVWLEVTNNSAETYWFLPSGLDPEYFSPLEAAFAFHKNQEEYNRQLDVHFQKIHFQNPIPAGSKKSGFVLVNLDEGFKAVDIDLISRKEVQSFSFVMPDPDFKADYKEIDHQSVFAPEDIIHIEAEDELQRALEKLPSFTTNADGDEFGDPLNLVLIGEVNDFLPAIIRRNWHATEVAWSKALRRTINSFLIGERYRYSPISPLYVYGRRQDIGWQKARGTINERNHMRFWQTPLRFRGKRVYVGQISRDIGVKFTLKSPTISTHIIDPDVDEARRYFTEDLAYSQAVARIGFVNGVGAIHKKAPKMNLVGDPFYTDGLRVVLFFEPRPFTLGDIDFLEWESPPVKYSMDSSTTVKKTLSKKEARIKERVLTKESNGIRVSTAVVGDKEAEQIFGIDLSSKNIQAVWLGVENNADRPVVLLPTAIDPEYFAPLEVAFTFHKSIPKKERATFDEQIVNLNFPNRSGIAPGASASGYIFTNWSKGIKVIDVDILGRKFSQNFTFFSSNPDASLELKDFIERVEAMFAASELKYIESEAELRHALEQLPCCVSDTISKKLNGEPLNVILIGAPDDWITALARRGYRYRLLDLRNTFGRSQDISTRKENQGYTKAQTHTLRLWQTPIRYLGMPVWAGQASSRLGGRFAENEPLEKTLPLDPHVDRARIDLAQDLVYSQALIKIGHVKGVGQGQPIQTVASTENLQYATDGLRVVLIFGDHPTSVSEIDFFNWEQLADHVIN